MPAVVEIEELVLYYMIMNKMTGKKVLYFCTFVLRINKNQKDMKKLLTIFFGLMLVSSASAATKALFLTGGQSNTDSAFDADSENRQ